MIWLIIIGIGSFVFTLLGTRLVIVSLRAKPWLMDMPNERSNHATPTPKGGGVAVVFSLVIFLLLGDASFLLIVSLLLLAGISLLDDWITLSPGVRIITQAMAILLAFTEVPETVYLQEIPILLQQVVIFLGWLWFTNLYNFMDGIDGISACEMISIAFGVCLILAYNGTIEDPLFAHMLAVAAAGAGFYWWNRHPAKIFLGDVGSIPVGFLLGYMLIQLAALGVDEGYLAAALILPAYYLTDSSITLIVRMLAGEKVWQAHSRHFYQQAVRKGMTHSAVVQYLFGVNFLLILLAIYAVLYPELQLLMVLIAYAMVAYILWFFRKPSNVDTT